MSYRQNTVKRICEICAKEILENQLMMDLFRDVSSMPNPVRKLAWVHQECGRVLLENYLIRRDSAKSVGNRLTRGSTTE